MSVRNKILNSGNAGRIGNLINEMRIHFGPIISIIEFNPTGIDRSTIRIRIRNAIETFK